MFFLKMIAISDVAELNMLVARSEQHDLFMLSFVRRCCYSKGKSDYR
ncbi:hypothetical protein HMPREF0105_1867 [Bacteroides sp. 3_1_33FAA]|uniref:Uncharacterized protein n=1 Tax=Phocaeicola dorei DSM 17855 TaxID=483217 RepID=B6VXU3_9BACT|nr:hypothetical protein BACDOR_02076 [Phocaeicola dorei DSM 17855]EEZ21313.1 hypothetical protein HMPREF0105_1867 [Bacteroides sp. 3_1_33FAA]